LGDLDTLGEVLALLGFREILLAYGHELAQLDAQHAYEAVGQYFLGFVADARLALPVWPVGHHLQKSVGGRAVGADGLYELAREQLVEGPLAGEKAEVGLVNMRDVVNLVGVLHRLRLAALQQ
jgi:hypothetical protein